MNTASDNYHATHMPALRITYRNPDAFDGSRALYAPLLDKLFVMAPGQSSPVTITDITPTMDSGDLIHFTLAATQWVSCQIRLIVHSLRSGGIDCVIYARDLMDQCITSDMADDTNI